MFTLHKQQLEEEAPKVSMARDLSLDRPICDQTQQTLPRHVLCDLKHHFVWQDEPEHVASTTQRGNNATMLVQRYKGK